LNATNYTITSPPTRQYNCIAWAADDELHWWWPEPRAYWPLGVPMDTTLVAFIEAFRTIGYETCQDGSLESGLVKIALYARGSSITHAARQLPSGHWTSKLGEKEDIEHRTPDEVCGPVYGVVVQFLSRPISP